jgi:chromosome segregation ATPase
MMVNKDNISKDFEEQIQSLAGDIYVQVEEKVSTLLTSLAAKNELTDEKVEQHQHYQSLKDSQEKLKKELEQANSEIREKLNQIEQENKNLSEKASSNEVSGEALESKQTEINLLKKQLDAFLDREHQAKDKLNDAEQKIKYLEEQQEELEKKDANLAKADKAKIIALDVQGKQISDLQLQLNNTNSELEHFQLEQNKLVETSTHDLVKERKQVTALNEKIAQLSEELHLSQDSQKQLVNLDAQQQSAIQDLTKDHDDLIKVLNEQKEQLKTYEDQLSQHGDNHEDVQNELEQLKESLANKQKIIEEKEAQITHLKQENSEQDQLQLLQVDKLSELESLNLKLTEEREQLQQNQKESNDKLHLVAKDYQDKITQLNEQLADAKKVGNEETDSILKAKTSLELEKEELNQKHQALQKSYQVLTADVAADKELVNKNKEVVDALNENLAKEQNEKQEAADKLVQLQQTIDELNAEVAAEKAAGAQDKEDIVTLKAKVEQIQNDHGNVQSRIESAKARFESDSDKARETIKYLRDENHEQTTKYEQRIGEIEDKLTEYRLRFEYAQRQLEKS